MKKKLKLLIQTNSTLVSTFPKMLEELKALGVFDATTSEIIYDDEDKELESQILEILDKNCLHNWHSVIIIKLNLLTPIILTWSGFSFCDTFSQRLIKELIPKYVSFDLLTIFHYIYIVIKRINQLKHIIMKQPKITWRKGGDDKIQFIVKIVAYKRDYGMVMAVTKTNDEIQPNDFTFFFPYDTDESKGTLMTFYKKNWPIKTIGTEKLGTLAEEEIGVTFDNHLTFSDTGETVNLMKLCLQSDAILFKYTSKDGEPKSIRFPLAGLAEHYLEQFI